MQEEALVRVRLRVWYVVSLLVFVYVCMMYRNKQQYIFNRRTVVWHGVVMHYIVISSHLISSHLISSHLLSCTLQCIDTRIFKTERVNTLMCQ